MSWPIDVPRLVTSRRPGRHLPAPAEALRPLFGVVVVVVVRLHSQPFSRSCSAFWERMVVSWSQKLWGIFGALSGSSGGHFGGISGTY